MNELSIPELEQLPYLRDLPAEAREKLLAVSHPRQLAQDEILFQEQEPYSGKLYLLQQGTIRIQRSSGEQYDIQPGGFVGLSNYLDKSTYHSTAMALTPARVLEFSENVLKPLESAYPAIADLISRVIAERIRTRSWRTQVATGPLAQPLRTIMKSPCPLATSA